MKTLFWLLRAFIVVGLLQVVSCTKTIETAPNDSVSVELSDDLTFPTTNEFSNCKLRRIYQHYPEGEGNTTVTGLFTYNSAGNPVSVVFDGFADDYFFYYDKQGRLNKYIDAGDFGAGIHTYSYDANNRIVTDTLNWSDLQVWIYTLTYDTQGRIIKENIRNTKNRGVEGEVYPLEPTRNPTYTYDSRGNLSVNGWKSSSYDNKVSIFRSHPIFQFIHRNYSKNNSSMQGKYNSKGLPLSIIPGNDYFFNLKNVTKAIYDCQ